MAKYPEWLYDGSEPQYDVKRHEEERIERGVSWYDWINFDSFLSYIIIEGMNRFLEDGGGHPGDLTMDEWNAMLITVRDGFQAHLDFEAGKFEDYDTAYEAMKIKRAAAFKILSERFGHMWD